MLLRPMALRLLFAVLVLSTLAACAHAPVAPPPPPATPGLPLDEIVRKVPPHVKDREGWGTDVAAAIRAVNKEPTAERVCAVLAVIEQESNFQPDPAVPELPRIVRQGLEEKLAKLGPLKGPAVDALLDGKPPGSDVTFRARIAKLKTERDLDRLFRDLAAAYRDDMPGTFAVGSALSMLVGKGKLESLNPVTTAGAMQVKVPFAKEREKDLADDDVRELLYTRAGGVRIGTARLIDYPASYDDITFRFADYNAGVYASRNAAFQTQLAALVGRELVPDGDLLAYEDDGDIKDVETNTLAALKAFAATNGVSSWTLSRDVKKEKSADFEKTSTWDAVRAAYEAKTGKKAPYARLPDVSLASPKLSRPRSTQWFAESVKKRYDACRAR